MDIRFNIRIIKKFIFENKKRSLKISGIAAVLLIAIIIYLTGGVNNNDTIMIIESKNSGVTAEQNAQINETPNELEQAQGAIQEREPSIIIIDIEGAVANPGVFYLEEGSRVNDAVLKAGGLTRDAETRWVNLAARLSDGDKVYIPRKNENSSDLQNTTGVQNMQGGGTSTRPQEPVGIITHNTAGGSTLDATASATNETNAKININTATSAQLQTLSGVGPVTAQKIIDYRENVGKFSKVEDIMRVSGIGIKTYESLKDKITI